MHKTKCWHKVSQCAEQGLVGRQEESFPLSLHLSIDISGSLSLSLSRLRFLQLQSNGSIQAPQHWLTAWIKQDVETPWDGVWMCVCLPAYPSIYMCILHRFVCAACFAVSIDVRVSAFVSLPVCQSMSVCAALMCPAGPRVRITTDPYVLYGAVH